MNQRDGRRFTQPGPVGTIGVANGGTGATSIAGALSNLGIPPGRRFLTGSYYAPMTTGADTTAALTQSTEYAVRFDVAASTTFDRIGIEVTTSAASNVVRLGIRNDLGSVPYPDGLVLDAGTVDASTTGFKEVTISQALSSGRYWVTATLQGGTGAVVRGRSGDPFVPNFTSSGTISSFTQTGVTGALASFSSTVMIAAAGPKILLRAA